MTLTPCKGCKKQMAWGLDTNGKTIPLDVRAPVYLILEDEPGVLRVRRAKAGEKLLAAVSHFSVCPNANDF